MTNARGIRAARRRALLGALAGLCLGLQVTPDAADAAVTGEEAAAVIQAHYGVEILRVRAGSIDGQPVWLITVMKPGGNSNDAFQVTTLAVDKDSGELVSNFRPGPSGLRQPGEAPPSTQFEQRPSMMRSGPWR